MGLKPRLLRRNIFVELLKFPTFPPAPLRGGVGGGLTSEF